MEEKIRKIVAEKMVEQNAENIKTINQSIFKAVEDALGKTPSRYIDVTRIPLICKSILDIHENIKKIDGKLDKFATKEELEVVNEKAEANSDNIKWAVRLVLSIVIVAIVGLVIKN